MATSPKTTSPKTTTRKTTSARTKATTSALATTTKDDAPDSVEVIEQVKSRDIIAAIAPTITVKRKDIRIVLEAALKEMGQALADGKVLNVPPMGKMEVKRVREGERANSLMVKLRRVKPGAKPVAATATSATALADSDD